MEWACGNVFIRPTLMHKGQVIEGHAHNFDHVSIALRGSVLVKPYQLIDTGRREKFIDEEGEERERPIYKKEFLAERVLRAPSDDVAVDQAHVLVKAGVTHEIEALKDNTVFWCVYAHRTPQGDVVQEFTGWDPAYT